MAPGENKDFRERISIRVGNCMSKYIRLILII